MRRQRRPGGFAKTRHDIDHAIGQSGFLQQFAQFQARQRRLLGHFQNRRAAGGQRGRQLPGGHQQRKIPRNNLADHADGFGTGVGQILPRRGEVGERNMFALDLGGPAGHVVEHVGGQRHVGDPRHTEGLAIVQAFELRQLVQMFQDQVADLVNDAAAGRRRHTAPRTVQRPARGLYRRVDVGGVAFGNFGQQHFGGGILHLEHLARRGLNPFAVDQHGPRLGQPVAQGCRNAINRGADGHAALPILMWEKPNSSVAWAGSRPAHILCCAGAKPLTCQQAAMAGGLRFFTIPPTQVQHRVADAKRAWPASRPGTAGWARR